MKNEINAFKEEHKWARPNSKPVQELERVAMATAFRKLYDAFCSDSKCWPMHITGQVWLVCDRDWSNKVVNDTMAECFLREPEDNKANDDENPRATEVVSTENAVIPVEENPGAAEVDMSGNAVGPVKENPGAPEVDMAEDQDGGFDA